MASNPLLEYVDNVEPVQETGNPLLQYVDDNRSSGIDYTKYRPTDYFPNDKLEDSKFVEKTNVIFESAKMAAIGGESILSNMGTMVQAIGDNMKLSDEEYAKSLEQGWGKDGLDRMQKVSSTISDWGKNFSSYWDDQQKSGWEVLNKKVWDGSYLENPSFTRTVAIGVGAIPSLASAYVVGVAAGPMSAYVFLSGLSAASTYKKADVAGKSQTEKNVLSGTVGVGTGVLERYIGPLNNFLKGGVGKKVLDVAIGGAKESMTEGSQQVLQNTVEKYGIDNTIAITDGVVEAMIAGGLSGGVMGAVTSKTQAKIESAINDMKAKGATDEEVNTVISVVGEAVISNPQIIDEGFNTIKEEVATINNEIIKEQQDEIDKLYGTDISKDIDINSVPIEIQKEVERFNAENIQKVLNLIDERKIKDLQKYLKVKLFSSIVDTEKPFLLEFKPSLQGDGFIVYTQKQSREMVEYIDKYYNESYLNDEATIKVKEIKNKLSKVLSSKDVKYVVRKSTGQIKDEGGVVSEKRAFLQSLKDRVKAAAQSRKATREEIFDVQSDVVALIKESDLELDDKAKFLTSVKNIQTQEDFNKVMPELEQRIIALEEKANKRSLVFDIKKAISRVEKSNSISIDYVDLINEAVSGFDLDKMQKSTIKKLEATRDYINKKSSIGEDVSMPKNVIEEISRLSKKNISDMTVEDLSGLLGKINLLEQLGKTKLDSRKKVYAADIDRTLEEISNNSSNIDVGNIKRALVGEKLSPKDILRNEVIKYKTIVKQKDLAILPQDIVFDIADGNKNFKGPNYTYLKKPIDVANNKYLNLKDRIKSEIINLIQKYDLDNLNFDRIGVYAAKVQEGGVDKLLYSGYTQGEIDSVELTESEMIVYNKMRSILDELRPQIEEVMRVVYNEPLGKVDNYFSFMTDFSKMEGKPIEGLFGDKIEFLKNKKNVDKDFTISRTNGEQAIKINALEIFLKHTDNAAYLIEMGPVIKKVGDIVDDPRYKSAVGSILHNEIRDWVSLVARAGRYQHKNMALEILRRNVGAYVLAYKIGSVLVQPTALVNGASEIGAERISKSLIDLAKSSKIRSFMMKNFPELRDRFGDDPAFIEFSGHYGDIGLKDKAINTGFLGIKYADMFTASVVTHAAYIKSLESKGLEFDINNLDEESMLDAQLIMRRTQSTSLFKDAPQAITNGKLFGDTSWDKLVLQFQSFMLNDWSRIRYDLIERGISVKDYNRAFNIATAMVISSALALSASDAVKILAESLGSDDDEKKKKSDDYLERLSTELLRKIPVVSQGMSAIQYGSMPVPSIEIVKRTFDRINRAYESKGKTKKSRDTKLDNEVKSTIAIMSIFGRIPGGDAIEDMYQLMRDASD